VLFAYIVAWAGADALWRLARRPPPSRPPRWVRPVSRRLAALALVAAGWFGSLAETVVALSPPAPAAVMASAQSTGLDAPSLPPRHVTVAGDNYWDLAAEHYGDGS